jgi:acyl-CoA synthetase (AMP-forming)/AMP-acid ligase II
VIVAGDARQSRIGDMLARSAERWPNAVALRDGDTALNYADLLRAVRSAATGLRALGLEPGDHVGFFLGENWRHVVALYGALQLGAIAVPLNLSWETAELEYAISATDLDALVVGRSHRARELWGRLADIGLTATGPRIGPPYPRLRYVLPDWEEDGPTLTEVVATPPDRRRPDAQTDLAYLMFTSGSTSRPKAAAIRHDAALRVAAAVAERLELTPSDRVLNISPFYHCAGLVCVLLASHQSGAAVSIFEGYQHEAMLDHMLADQSTILIGFDVVTMRLIRGALEQGAQLPIRKMLSGPGRPIFDDVSALGVDLAIMYGLTEASNVVSLTRTDDDHAARRDSNGLPLPGIDVRICDHDTGRALPAGQLGEIAFRGWNLMSGYYFAGEVGLELDGDGFFHTGDCGFVDEAGRVYYRGRYASMIKTGGENVSELEVESFLATEFPWLDTVAVIGLPDERWGEIVIAVVSCPEDRLDEVAGLRERCRGRIAGYKVPKAFVALPSEHWPVSPTGKVLKSQLGPVVRSLLEPHARQSQEPQVR